MATDREIAVEAIRRELDRQQDLPTWDSLGWLAWLEPDRTKAVIEGRLDVVTLADAVLSALAKRPQMTTTN